MATIENQIKDFSRIIPEHIETIASIFIANGYKFYLIGGCVRNFLITAPIKDWDATTDATPEQMIKLSNENNLDIFKVGEKYGTITFLDRFNLKNNIEVTTFRSDGEYDDNRHPNKVNFSKSIKEDIKRRDFTMNTLYFDMKTRKFPKSQSNHIGIQDLKNYTVRCVGNPNERFREDGLRMMRAIRFCTEYGFILDKEVFKSIILNRALITSISDERVRDELIKIFKSDRAIYGLSLLKQTRLLDFIIPEIVGIEETSQCNQYHIHNVWSHTLSSIDAIYKEDIFTIPWEALESWKLRLVMFLHDIGKINTRKENDYFLHSFIGHSEESYNLSLNILKRLKFDNKTIQEISILIRYHDIVIKTDEKYIKKWIFEIGHKLLINLLLIREADIAAQSDNLEHKKELYNINIMKKIIFEFIYHKNQPIFLCDLAINGVDLVNIGLKGEIIGKVLKRLLKHVWSIPEDNTKEKLLSLVKGVMK